MICTSVKLGLLSACLISSCLLAGCRSQRSQAPPSIADSLLTLAEVAGRQLEIDLPARGKARDQLSRLTHRARSLLAASPETHPVDQLNLMLFDELGFQREVDDEHIRFMMLPTVLDQKRGSCLGLAAVYLSLAEKLKLPLFGVLVPGHFFVRYQDAAGIRDVELLKRGAQMPRSWYQSKYSVPPANPLYLRSLTPAQTLAVFRFNLANTLRTRGQYKKARLLYQQVVAVLPDFAEAQGNLGLTHHRLGELTRAERAYLRARAANRNLQGLQRNLDALRGQ